MTRTRLASPTLARLYLAQGHLDEALAVARAVKAQQGPEGGDLGAVEQDLDAAVAARARALEDLLEVVRRRRAAHRTGTAGTTGTSTATHAHDRKDRGRP